MTVNLCRTSADPLSNKMLFAWHGMLFQGRRDLQNIGRYRTDPSPMQIVSSRLDSPKVHLEAPPSAKVPKEMARFVEWFNRTAPQGAIRCRL